MPKSHAPYPPEFRRQMVELVRAGRDLEQLSREFEPTAQSIRNWVAAEATQSTRAKRGEGQRDEGCLSAVEREELHQLRRENRQLREEREIL